MELSISCWYTNKYKEVMGGVSAASYIICTVAALRWTAHLSRCTPEESWDRVQKTPVTLDRNKRV